MRGLLVAALTLVLGCAPEAVIGKDTDGGDSESGGSESGTTGNTASSASESAGTHGGSGGSTGEPLCPPHQPLDACDVCMFESCCPDVQACDTSMVCGCIRDCVEEGHGLDACKTDCGDDGGLFDALHMCQASHCGAAC